MNVPDVLVLGSGPAGVSAAFPLVEGGLSVLMLEGGEADPETLPGGPAHRLGAGLEALRLEDGLSPKLRTPESRQLIGRYRDASGTVADGFTALAGLGPGGLSRVWGGQVCELTAADLGGWPFGADELAEAYRRVSGRIGVSGATGEVFAPDFGSASPLLPPPRLGRNAEALLARYRAARGRRLGDMAGLRLGRARNALLTEDRGDRAACDGNGGCLWGCLRGAVYDARADLAQLRRMQGFSTICGAYVVRIDPVSGGYEAVCADGRRFRAPRIVLAAGVLETTRLAAGLVSDLPVHWRLESSPVLAMPFLCRDGLLKSPLATHSLAQLAFQISPEGDGGSDPAYGAVYEINALPASAFAARIPLLGRRGATALTRLLGGGLVVATSYLAGRHSSNRITVRPGPHGQPVLRIAGETPSATRIRLDEVRHALARRFRALGAVALPGADAAMPGLDAHYGATLPMGSRRAAATGPWGELNGRPGIFVVDGACLPAVSSKPTTLTIMANADRIGRHLAAG